MVSRQKCPGTAPVMIVSISISRSGLLKSCAKIFYGAKQYKKEAA